MTAYRHRKADPDFGAAWAEAVAKGNDDLEASAMERAINGWEEEVYQGGQLVGTRRVYNAALTIFMLKCKMPKTYNVAPIQPVMSLADQQDEFVRTLNQAVAGMREATPGLGRIESTNGSPN